MEDLQPNACESLGSVVLADPLWTSRPGIASVLSWPVERVPTGLLRCEGEHPHCIALPIRGSVGAGISAYVPVSTSWEWPAQRCHV